MCVRERRVCVSEQLTLFPAVCPHTHTHPQVQRRRRSRRERRRRLSKVQNGTVIIWQAERQAADMRYSWELNWLGIAPTAASLAGWLARPPACHVNCTYFSLCSTRLTLCLLSAAEDETDIVLARALTWALWCTCAYSHRPRRRSDLTCCVMCAWWDATTPHSKTGWMVGWLGRRADCCRPVRSRLRPNILFHAQKHSPPAPGAQTDLSAA